MTRLFLAVAALGLCVVAPANAAGPGCDYDHAEFLEHLDFVRGLNSSREDLEFFVPACIQNLHEDVELVTITCDSNFVDDDGTELGSQFVTRNLPLTRTADGIADIDDWFMLSIDLEDPAMLDHYSETVCTLEIATEETVPRAPDASCDDPDEDEIPFCAAPDTPFVDALRHRQTRTRD